MRSQAKVSSTFSKVVGVQRAKPLVASAEAKYPKLTVNACRKSVIINKSKGAIHIKKVKQNVRNQFRKPKNCELRHSLYTEKLSLQVIYANEVNIYDLQRCMNWLNIIFC